MKVFLIATILLCISIAFIFGLPVNDAEDDDIPPPEKHKNNFGKRRVIVLNDTSAWVGSGLFEGDLYFPLAATHRHGLKEPHRRWPDGIIPYVIDKSFNSDMRAVINGAMQEFHQKTCIRFRKYKKGDKYWVAIRSDGSGCNSAVGMNEGGQVLNLQIQTATEGGCVFHGIVVHELMHSVGFYHQQSAPNRDNYVEVHLENVENGAKFNFDKYSDDINTDFGYGYDFMSVMHYPGDAFSKNNKDTMIPQPKYGDIVLGKGYMIGLSEKDVGKIGAMYKGVCKN